MRKVIQCLLFVSTFFAVSTVAFAEIRLIPGRIATFDIAGKPSSFNPKNPHVYVDVPRDKGKVPVLLYIHGGGGYISGDKNVVEFFKEMGFATIAFDAFRANNLSMSVADFSKKLSLPAKQKMLLPMTKGALDWIMTQEWADTHRIYIYGHSNGARIALHLADKANQKNVRFIVAEAPPPCCVDFPNKVSVPVKLIYGDKDNWGGVSQSDHMFTRKPMGGRMPSVKSWSDRHRNSKLEIKFYNGGHGLFHGEFSSVPALQEKQRWNKGGETDKLKEDLKSWVSRCTFSSGEAKC